MTHRRLRVNSNIIHTTNIDIICTGKVYKLCMHKALMCKILYILDIEYYKCNLYNRFVVATLFKNICIVIKDIGFNKINKQTDCENSLLFALQKSLYIYLFY